MMLIPLTGLRVVPLRRISLGSAASIRPSSTALSLSGVFLGAGAISRLPRGQRCAVAPDRLSAHRRLKMQKLTTTHTHAHAKGQLRVIVSPPKCMSLDQEEARELSENPRGHGKNMHTEEVPFGRSDSSQETSCCNTWRAAYTIKPGLHDYKDTQTAYSCGHFGNEEFIFKHGDLNASRYAWDSSIPRWGTNKRSLLHYKQRQHLLRFTVNINLN